jgi:hypothetical protein
MNHTARKRLGAALLVAGATAAAAATQGAAAESNCKAIHAVMLERRATEGCKPEHSFCFLGEVSGNHGVRGTTYFRGDGSGSRPTTSPDFLPYSGPFEYHLKDGSLVMRETGVVNTTTGNLDSGAITAFQKVVDATGEWAGTTGYFFVNGFNRDGRIETTVTGELCRP